MERSQETRESVIKHPNDLLSRRSFLKLTGESVAGMALFAGSASYTHASPASDVSIDVKIGQMLLAGFRGLETTPDLPIVKEIQSYHLGGVLLFDYDVTTGSPIRNIQSSDQLKTLIHGLQAVSSIPLLIAVDQEGGQVTRLKTKHGFPSTVSADYLGRQNDETLTHHHATIIAQTLAKAGINLNLAPVVDLNSNPRNPIIGRRQRSLSHDPAVVTAHAAAFIEAHHRYGVLCCLKHFPGHGSSSTDTHRGLTDVTESWSSDELIPYTEIIKTGQADTIMTSHVFHAALDPDYPATLSKSVITGLLRKKTGYDGVVVTDDMQMGAIAGYYGFESALQCAIDAGVDILTLGNNQAFDEDLIPRTVSLIKTMVADGRISEARIDESYQRIRRLKSRIGAF